MPKRTCAFETTTTTCIPIWTDQCHEISSKGGQASSGGSTKVVFQQHLIKSSFEKSFLMQNYQGKEEEQDVVDVCY